eukprot:scaffold93601_cov32-Tisochrysis_lutea.AAC.4
MGARQSRCRCPPPHPLPPSFLCLRFREVGPCALLSTLGLVCVGVRGARARAGLLPSGVSGLRPRDRYDRGGVGAQALRASPMGVGRSCSIVEFQGCLIAIPGR